MKTNNNSLRKSNHRGAIIPCLLSVIAALFLTSCSSKFLDKPENTDLEFWITEKVSMENYQLGDCTYLPGLFGGTRHLDGRYEPVRNDVGHLFEPEIHVVYTVTAYPDYSDGGEYVTSIDITDPGIYVYGLTMNSSQSEIHSVMANLGFKGENSRYTKNNCVFCFNETGIIIGASVTNKKNISF